ncbi:hypothetical protein I6F07_03940 [Ensifer sp. IC4062]|nr:hypothetical protein [Ensifer sp. IC4062]MCA1439383.1 hypothetical protein [Ensifer sp. IC4062]
MIGGLGLAVSGSPCVVYDTMPGTARTVRNVAAGARCFVTPPGRAREVEARMTADERLLALA